MDKSNADGKEKRKPHTKIEYQLLNRIGHGAYGVVYRALNKINNKELAIKIINFEDDEVLSDQMCEIDLLKNLKNENIVKYYGFIQKRHKLYLLLEYCSNGSLRDLIKLQPSGYLPETEAKKYIVQTLKGLKYLHDQGVIHRDIKSANLLINDKNVIKLADFGVSTKVSNIAMTCVGSPNWMAPEILLGQGATTKSDIWSIGATVVEMVTGEPPFFNLNNREAVCYAVMHDTYHIPAKFKLLSQNCKNFIKACFHKNIFKRPNADFLLLNDQWIIEDNLISQKLEKLNKFKENDDFYIGFGEDDLLGSPKKKPTTTASIQGPVESTPALLRSPPPPPPLLSSSSSEVGTSASLVSQIHRHNIIVENNTTPQENQRSISSSSSFNDEYEMENDGAYFLQHEFFRSHKLNERVLNKIFTDCSTEFICQKILNICLSCGNDSKNNLFNLIQHSTTLPNFDRYFVSVQGPASLIPYVATLPQELKRDWHSLLLNNSIYQSYFSNPQLFTIVDFKNVSLTTLDMVLKITKELIHRYNNTYMDSIICGKTLPYLYKNFLLLKTDQQQAENFQQILYQVTDLKVCVEDSFLKKIIGLPHWRFPVLKVLNNCCKNNLFQLPHFVFEWLVAQVLPSILQKFDSGDNKSVSTENLELVDLKMIRYFLEVLYATIHLNQTFKNFLLSNVGVPKLALKLVDLNKTELSQIRESHKKRLQNENHETIMKYYNYVIKYVIRLSSELSNDLNLIDNYNAALFENYCLVGFHYLKNFQNSSYSWCSIDILSSCLPKLYQKGVINFQLNLITYKNEVFSSNLILQNLFDEEIINSVDCEKIFKKINKLLVSCSSTYFPFDSADGNKTSIVVLDGSNNDNADVARNSSSQKHESTVEETTNKNIPPFAQLIIDDDKFLSTVEKILDKYKGSLIIQIDFLKFLKTLFHQYVQYRFNEYSETEKKFTTTSDSTNGKVDYLQLAMRNKTRKSFSYDLLKNSHLSTRTNNFKRVNELLSKLWEETVQEGASGYNFTDIQKIEPLERSVSPSASSPPSSGSSSLGSTYHTGGKHNVNERVGHNSILIKQLVKDINKIYNESITLA